MTNVEEKEGGEHIQDFSCKTRRGEEEKENIYTIQYLEEIMRKRGGVLLGNSIEGSFEK